MSLNIIQKTNFKESLKLLNHINSFLFEQQYGELSKFSASQIEDIRKASRTLSDIIRK